MPSAGSIAATAESTGTSALLTGLGAVGGPAGMAIGAGVGALITLISDIGSGRKIANTFTQNGGPQDIINKQLAAISSSNASAQEKQQATQVAWTGFLQAANQFASQGKEQAQVAKQAIFNTPGLTNTVQTLGGFNPLDASFTSQLSPSIPGATPQSGVSWQQFIAPTLGAVGGGLLGSAIAGAGGAAATGAGTTIGDASSAATSAAGIGDPLGVGAADFGAADSADIAGDAGIGAVDGPAVGSGVYGPFGPGAGGATAAAEAAGAPGATASSSSSLLSRLFPSLISGGTSLLSGIIGSNAATSAAQIQANAANNAAMLDYQAGQNSLAFQQQVLAQQQQNAQPWINAGTSALNTIGQITSTPYTLPTADEAAQTPGYQFQLQQGLNAVQAYEKASGLALSGAAVKDVNNYVQGTASTNYQNTVNNSLAARAANLNPLLSVAGLGQVSATGLNSNLTSAEDLNTQTQTQTAQNVENAQSAAAQATASGYVGSANSWLSSLGQVGNTINQQQTIAQILKALQSQSAAA